MVKRRGFKGLRFLLTGILFLILLTGAGALVVKFLPQIRGLEFGNYGRYSVVVNQNPIVVVSLDSVKNEAVAIKFPDDLLIRSAHGYGNLAVSKLYAVGQLDGRGDRVLLDSLSSYLGLNIFSVVSAKSSVLGPGNRLNRMALVDPGRLADVDLIVFLARLMRVRSDKVVVIDLGPPEAAAEIILADGSRALSLETERLDQLLGDHFFDQYVVSENLRLSVVNATPVNGLGSIASRFLVNQGANVVSVQSQEESQGDCRIRFSSRQAETSRTLRLAKGYFSCEAVFDETLDKRFDLEIILGSTFARRFGIDGN